MLSTVFVVLISFFLPEGSEPYLSADSIYTEYEQADITVSIFDDALAGQAVREFRDGLAAPETTRAGLIVDRIDEGEIAGRPAITVEYTKPALVAKLDEKGDVIVVQGLERTRQTYLDLGAQNFVLTVWSKVASADIAAVSDNFVANIKAGSGEIDAMPVFLVAGVPIEEFAASRDADILSAPLRIDLSTE